MSSQVHTFHLQSGCTGQVLSSYSLNVCTDGWRYECNNEGVLFGYIYVGIDCSGVTTTQLQSGGVQAERADGECKHMYSPNPSMQPIVTNFSCPISPSPPPSPPIPSSPPSSPPPPPLPTYKAVFKQFHGLSCAQVRFMEEQYPGGCIDLGGGRYVSRQCSADGSRYSATLFEYENAGCQTPQMCCKGLPGLQDNLRAVSYDYGSSDQCFIYDDYSYQYSCESIPDQYSLTYQTKIQLATLLNKTSIQSLYRSSDCCGTACDPLKLTQHPVFASLVAKIVN